MKKYKILNIIFISLGILTCFLSFVLAINTSANESMKAIFINISLCSLAALVFALVLVCLSKEKIILIPMLIVFLNALFTFNILSSLIFSSKGEGLFGPMGTTTTGMDVLEVVIIVLAILGIVFTCLKHKWGAVVGIVGIAYMIYSQYSFICVLLTLSEDIGGYPVLASTSAAVLFQFVWLLIPMILLLCEKKQAEKTTQVEEQTESK